MTGPTQVPLQCVAIFVYETVTLYGRPFQALPLTQHNPILRSYNPERETLSVWALPISLAATDGIDFSLYSSRYLDVSVPWVCHIRLCIQRILIRVPRDYRSFVSSPKFIADFHALHRLLMPRHPPCALSNLTIGILNFYIQNPWFAIALVRISLRMALNRQTQ